jgi:hypothetical protein
MLCEDVSPHCCDFERALASAGALLYSTRSPDMESAEFIQLKSSWKERLHTREFGMNENWLTDVKWCQPRLTVRVKHLAGSKTLRHATVRELLLA